MSRVRAYLELARVSNLPTVWSNVLMGVVLGGVVRQEPAWPAEQPLIGLMHQLRQAWPLMFAMSLVYVGGMVLNDAMDAPIDRERGSGRPIPSGRVKRSTAFILATTLFIGGIAVSAAQYTKQVLTAVLVLVVTTVVYDALHHRFASSRLLMGLCRFWLVIAAGVVAGSPDERLWPIVVIAGGIVMAYTWFISALAASEWRRGIDRRSLVMRLIAGFCALDAVMLLVFGQWPAGMLCLVFGLVTTLGHRQIAGT